MLPDWAEDNFDSIDAGFFSADTFHNNEAIERAEFYIDRWQREIVKIKEMMSSDDWEK